MTYFLAKCELCTQYAELDEVALAYLMRVSPTLAGPKMILEQVELNGKQPWCGIRVICKRCVEFVKGTTGPVEKP